MTVDEVLGALHGALTRRQFKSWVAYGLVPIPVRRVPPGAPDRVARALYPWWVVPLIAELLHERAGGTKLTERQASAQERIARWRKHPPLHSDVARATPPLVASRRLQRAAWAYCTLQDERITAVTLVLRDAAGTEMHIPIAAPPAPQRRRVAATGEGGR